MTELAIDRGDIEDAADRIAPHARVTPTLTVDARDFGLEVDATITLKLECLQHAGSFKTRGAFNRVLSNEVPAAGVITASGGNHGVAVSHVAARLGVRAEVFVTETTPEAKIARIRSNGADVVVAGRYYDDAQTAMHERAEETGALFVHPFNQPETLAGQGTLGRELERQAPELDSVLVAVGGGGLIAGVAAWYEGRARVVSVEPELIPAMERALDAGAPVEVSVGGIAADSLGTKEIGSLAFPIAQKYVADAVLVSDEAIVRAQRALWDRVRVLAEPGGSAAMAALLSGAYRPRPGENIGVIVCGANTDPAVALG
ncbi:MAG TPA: threonine/serine dehydratase [Acidimicrobiales bacterium]|nr:threonine/serine dehydratase [Acidimicrobiales bacterium]